jgi:hypothetical protein
MIRFDRPLKTSDAVRANSYNAQIRADREIKDIRKKLGRIHIKPEAVLRERIKAYQHANILRELPPYQKVELYPKKPWLPLAKHGMKNLIKGNTTNQAGFNRPLRKHKEQFPTLGNVDYRIQLY